jgi:hypothetical protein
MDTNAVERASKPLIDALKAWLENELRRVSGKSGHCRRNPRARERAHKALRTAIANPEANNSASPISKFWILLRNVSGNLDFK